MRASFNALDAPWIPVITAEGTEELLGIRQTLFRAHELREISSASPLEEYSVYRFLGLFLMDALRPERESDIEDLLDGERFDKGEIEDYITLCESEGVSFDLFDENRPFLQSKFDEKTEKPDGNICRIDLTKASGNNHTHFDHGAGKNRFLQADDALRQLLITYTFITIGGRGFKQGVNGTPPYFSLIQGKQLYETLINTLLPIERIGIPFDSPPVFWRRESIQKEDLPVVSWMQGMLLPARRIQLVPDSEGRVTDVYFSQGESFVNNRSWRDPYVSYQLRTKKPVVPEDDKAIWQNLCDIINFDKKMSLLELYRNTHVGETPELIVYGFKTDQAKYIQVFRYTLSIPAKLLNPDNEESILLLYKAVSIVDNLECELKKALLDVYVPEGEDKKKKQKKNIQQSFKDCLALYLRQCELRFWDYCDKICASEPRLEAFIGFVDDVAKFANAAFDRAVLEGDLRAHSLVKAESARIRLLQSIETKKKEARM